MDKKTKNILIVISVVMILVAVIIVISKLIAPTTSTNNTNANIKDTTIDGLRISNVNLVGNELTAYVQNTTSNSISIQTITVKFIDKDNNEIDSVNAYFGGIFASNEIRNLDVKTDTDLSNLGDITYTVNKTSCLVTKTTNFSARNGQCGWNFSFTGTYQCDGITGYLTSCIFNGKQRCSQWTDIKATITNLPFNINCCNGNYISGGELALKKCNSNYNFGNNEYNNTIYPTNKSKSIPNTISCSCE